MEEHVGRPFRRRESSMRDLVMLMFSLSTIAWIIVSR
jgi:hypothetical protein